MGAGKSSKNDLLWVAFAALCLSCEDQAQISYPPLHETISALRAAPKLNDFVLFAESSLSVRQAAVVHDGALGVIARGAGGTPSDGARLAVWQLAEIDSDLAADSIRLRQHATVGDLYTSTLTSSTAAHGSVFPFPASMPAMPSLSPVTPGSLDVALAQGARQRLDPGAFGRVTLGQSAELELSAGVYHIAELSLGEGSQVLALGPLELRVAGRILPGAKTYLGPAINASLTAEDLRIEVSGPNGATGAPEDNPEVATFGEGSRVRALVLAPNGTLRARSNAQLTGAFFARDLVVGQGSLVTFEDGFARNLPPVADAGGPYSANEGEAVALDASGSRDPDGDLLTYEWDLDADGSFDDASGSTLVHVFPNDGAYSIRVRVTDPSGETATASGLVSITNLPPVAADDALRVPEDSGLVTLDPLANDLDWDSLSIFGFTQPRAGTVALSGAALEISIPDDFFGTLAFDVTVTDGVALSSASVAVEVDPIPDAPVARNHALEMREDSLLTLAAPGLLEGAFDADGDPLVARLVSVTPGVTSAAVDLDGALRLRPLPDFEGTIQVVYSADDGLLSSQAVASVLVEDENDAPRFVSIPPTSTAVGELYTYEVGTFDPDRNDSTTLSIDEGPAGMELDAQLVSFTPSEPGDFGVVVRAADTHGAFALQSYSLHVFQPNRPPQIVSIPGRVAAAGEEYEYVVAISDPDTDETFELALESGPSGMVLEGRRLSFTPARSQLGPHLVTIRVADRSGAEARQSFVIEVFDVPVLVAPPIDLTVATSVYEANKFLIEGPAPVQTGGAPGAIDPRRAVWLRGRALLPDGSPAPGAQVSVVGSPELGSTRTRLDGFYDLLVNGGSWVTVRIERGGSFPVDRAIDTVWQETYSFPEVVLSSPRPGTGLDLTLPGAKVALGQLVEDERGARRAAVLFPPGVAAYSGGVPIDELTVSITELSAGPSALTAPLPPTTGYGFVAELVAAESTELVFSSPVYVHLENFLNIPAGKSVPSGSYDRGSARWVPGHDGRAITLLGVDALGRAELDTDGDGSTDQGLGVSDEERALLATLYPAPASLLRVPLRHLSTWAFGYGFAPPVTAEYPSRPAPSSPAGSGVIEQQIDLVSTTFHLVYESDRVVGFEAPRTLEIPVAGSLVPVGLLSISSDLDIAGRKLSRSLSPAGERVERIVWDGLDAFGRPLQGGQPARVRVAYEYPSELYSADPAAFVDAFGQALGRGDFVVEISSPTTVSLVQEWRGALGGWDARSQGLGGWWLDVHHAYDPFTRTLYEGNGVTRRASELGLYSRTIAGTGEPGSAGDGGPAVEAQLRDPSSVVTAPDGTVYVAESAQVRRIDPDGTIHSVFDSAAQQLLVNGNAEADPPLAGWTAVAGEWSAAAPYWSAVEGARYFFGEGTSLELRQDVDLSARAAAIDLGTEQFEFSALTNGADFLTTPVATIELTDELGLVILSVPFEGVGAGALWSTLESQLILPPGTRGLSIRLGGQRAASPFRPEPVILTAPKRMVCEGQIYLSEVRVLPSADVSIAGLPEQATCGDTCPFPVLSGRGLLAFPYPELEELRFGSAIGIFWPDPPLGTHVFELIASNEAGYSTQQLEIEVVPCTGATPAIESTPVTTATVRQPYFYDVDARISAGDFYANGGYTWNLVTPHEFSVGWDPYSPYSAWIDYQMGSVTLWALEEGTFPVEVGLIEGWPGPSPRTTSQAFEVEVSSAHLPPCVPFMMTSGPAPVSCSIPALLGTARPYQYAVTGDALASIGGFDGALTVTPTGVPGLHEFTVLIDDPVHGRVGSMAFQVSEPDPNPELAPARVGFDAVSLRSTSRPTVSPSALALLADGTLLVADRASARVLSVRRDGINGVFAGGGFVVQSGQLATDLALVEPSGLAVSPDGSVLIADAGANRVYRVGTDGRAWIAAGTGELGYSGDGNAARSAQLAAPRGIAIDSFGVVYLADTENHVVRRVGNDGNIETFAGTGVDGYGGDGGVALGAQLSRPEGVSIGKEGSVLVADTGNDAVRIVAPDGTIGTLMGGPSATGDGFAPASQVRLAGPKAVLAAGDDDRSILVADSDQHTLRRVGPAWPGFGDLDTLEVESVDGSLVFVFDPLGRHLETRNPGTGEVVYRFEYGEGGTISQVWSGSELSLLVERDSFGRVEALVGPGGETYRIGLDEAGYLTSAEGATPDSFRYDDEGTALVPGKLVYLSSDNLIAVSESPGSFAALGSAAVEPCILPLGGTILPRIDSARLVTLSREQPGYGTDFVFVIEAELRVESATGSQFGGGKDIIPLYPEILSSTAAPGMLSFGWDATYWQDGLLRIAPSGQHYLTIDLRLVRYDVGDTGISTMAVLGTARVEGVLKAIPSGPACGAWVQASREMSDSAGYIDLNGHGSGVRPTASFRGSRATVLFGNMGEHVSGPRIETVRSFVGRYPELFGMPAVLGAITVVSETAEIDGITRLLMTEVSPVPDPRPVFGSKLVAIFDRSDQLVFLTGQLTDSIPSGPFPENLDESDAVDAALVWSTAEGLAPSAITVEQRVLVARPGVGLVAAYQVGIDEELGLRRAVIAADDGAVLRTQKVSSDSPESCGETAQSLCATIGFKELDPELAQDNDGTPLPGTSTLTARLSAVFQYGQVRISTQLPYRLEDRAAGGVVSETFFHEDEGVEAEWDTLFFDRIPDNAPSRVTLEIVREATFAFRQLQRLWDRFGDYAPSAGPLDLVINSDRRSTRSRSFYHPVWSPTDDDEIHMKDSDLYTPYHEAFHHLEDNISDMEATCTTGSPCKGSNDEHRVPGALVEGLANAVIHFLDPYPVDNSYTASAATLLCALRFPFRRQELIECVRTGFGVFRKSRVTTGRRPVRMVGVLPVWPDCRVPNPGDDCLRVLALPSVPPADCSVPSAPGGDFVWRCGGENKEEGTYDLIAQAILDAWESTATAIAAQSGPVSATRFAASFGDIIVGALRFVSSDPSFDDWRLAVIANSFVTEPFEVADLPLFSVELTRAFARHGIDDALRAFCARDPDVCH